jgi:hypothetical protein
LRSDGYCFNWIKGYSSLWLYSFALTLRQPLLRFLAALPSTAAIPLDGFASTAAFQRENKNKTEPKNRHRFDARFDP